MSHPNAYPSRRIHSNIQDPQHVRGSRNRPRRYQVTADHGQPSDQNTVDDQPPDRSTPQHGDIMAMPYSDAVSSTCGSYDEALWPEQAVEDRSGIDEASNNYYYFNYSAIEEPVQEEVPVICQPVRYDQGEALMPPAISPTDTDGVAAATFETAYNLTEPIPWSKYEPSQAGHTWTVPTHRGWEAESNVGSDPIGRRWSMQARQGSVAAFSGDVVAPIPVSPSDTIQEQDGSGASGGDTTPDARVREFVGGEAPWCPLFLRREPSCRYP
ncbi:hypothetical protein F4679DRAFT_582623 [Xylaria curta]|nr:hypothetical protein F4679DRAFT_582623 [Xylaria curta]